MKADNVPVIVLDDLGYHLGPVVGLVPRRRRRIVLVTIRQDIKAADLDVLTHAALILGASRGPPAETAGSNDRHHHQYCAPATDLGHILSLFIGEDLSPWS